MISFPAFEVPKAVLPNPINTNLLKCSKEKQCPVTK